jgi:transcriptional regulator with XRE-family HTH domain
MDTSGDTSGTGPSGTDKAGTSSTSFGELLRARRGQHARSTADLARDVDLSRSLLSRFESGERRPSREQALKVARALQLSARETDELLDAAGFRPAAYGRVSLADPDLQLVADVLGDASVPAEEKDAFRMSLRLLAHRWRPGALGDRRSAAHGP